MQYYQNLFRDGECFLHIVSLLNGSLDETDSEKLVLNVLQTITCLLADNDSCKVFCFLYSLETTFFGSVSVFYSVSCLQFPIVRNAV